MPTACHHFASCWILAATLVLAGCLERKEKLVISADGSATLTLAFKTDSLDELDQGDAAPTIDGGWWIEQRSQRKRMPVVPIGEDPRREPQMEHLRTAELHLPAGVPWPANYAAIGDVDPDVYLQFPTSLTIERRADGVYYHFRRVYQPRQWAQLDLMRQSLQEELEKAAADELGERRSVELARTLAQLEVIKHLHWARQAFRAAAADLPQDVWLSLATSLGRVGTEVDVQPLVRLVAAPKGIERNQDAVQQELVALRDWIDRRMEEKIKSVPGFGGRHLAAFLRRYDWHRRSYEVTEDLGDDQFEITVQMPGEIVGTNALSVQDATVAWAFPGSAVRDREVELMVSSRVR
jgi:hypothetical protein